MKCDICAKETADIIAMRSSGQTLMVCSVCRSSGTKIEKPAFVVTRKEPKTQKESFSTGLQQTGELTLADDYTKRIQRARQKKNWTFKELSEKTFEKESTLKKVESGALLPEDALVKKLEKVLETKLMEFQ